MNAAPDAHFWRDAHVLVTGSTGFKGSWLCLWLNELGAKVDGYALAPVTTQSLFECVELSRNINQRLADVRDAARVKEAVQACTPKIVFHLAAQPLVRESYREPVETFATNILGTAHLLEAVRHTPSVAAVIVVTSDKVYDNQEWHWGYRERDRLGGRDPYSASKACAELVTQSYQRSFFSAHKPAIATVRAGNVIGGGDFAAERLLPDAVRAFTSGRTLQLRNPEATRPWQHVIEPVFGYLRLAERLCHAPAQFSGAWNLGPAETENVSVAHVATTFARSWGSDAQGKPAEWAREGASAAPHEAGQLRLDTSKAKHELGVRGRLTLLETIDWTVAWYRQHAMGADSAGLRALCLQQINSYRERLLAAD
jgi:CDP-glucose 4,6-dehydratase